MFILTRVSFGNRFFAFKRATLKWIDSQSVSQSISQSVSQSVSQSINQSINQSIRKYLEYSSFWNSWTWSFFPHFSGLWICPDFKYLTFFLLPVPSWLSLNCLIASATFNFLLNWYKLPWLSSIRQKPQYFPVLVTVEQKLSRLHLKEIFAEKQFKFHSIPDGSH